MVSYEATTVTVYSEDIFQKSPNFSAFEIEDDVLTNLKEFALANAIYWALVEGHACEVSSYRNIMSIVDFCETECYG
jgi:F-type H+-transporting ATPase subunit gamma